MRGAADAIDELAARLAAARARRVPIARTLTLANATLEDAYAVQRALAARARAAGRTPYGFKVGVTSGPALARAGLSEPLVGFLEAEDAIPSGSHVDVAELIAPRIEMELAFVTRAELAGADCDDARALDAIDYAVPAFEIIDARYEPGPFDAVAAVADNTSTAKHVVGTTRLDPRRVDLAAVAATLKKNGVEVARGTGGAVLGDPVRSLTWLVRTLARWNAAVPAGSLVLTGGFADALPATAGDTFVAEFTTGGTIACTFTATAPRAGGAAS